MTDTIVASRYAGALFALGSRAGRDAREQNGAVLQNLAEMLKTEPRLEQVFKSPVVTSAEKKAIVSKLLGLVGADRIMSNFCNLLADKNRLGELAGIAARYAELLDEANGVLRGNVVTAIKLSPAKQEKIKAELKKKLGRDIELTFGIDPEILGGMVLTVGDKVLDSSLRAQLGIMRQILIRGK